MHKFNENCYRHIAQFYFRKAKGLPLARALPGLQYLVDPLLGCQPLCALSIIGGRPDNT